MPQLQQKMDALGRANAVRTQRKETRIAVASGELDPIKVLLEDRPELRTVPIVTFLSWVPRIGKAKATYLLRRAQVHSPTLPVGNLTTAAIMRIADNFPQGRSALVDEGRGQR